MQMQLLKTIIGIVMLTAISTPAFSQIRVVSYNSAQFNGDPTEMAEVLQAASDDDSHGFAAPVSIFLFQEVDEAELSTLQKVVGANYTTATFTDQNDSSWGGAQAMFYLSTQFIEHTPSHADIFTNAGRHADRWGLNLVGYENLRIYVYSMHLKAGSGSTNEGIRRDGAENVRDDINTLPIGSRIIVAGDMNFYSPSDDAYQWFTATGDGQLIDPLGIGSSWGGESNALKHTQSPLLSQQGGLIGGGLDDRFDFQFLSPTLLDGDGVSLIDGTYRSLGNDGQHYNMSINTGNNSYFPGDTARGNTLADQLYLASDHLPLIADYQVPALLAWSMDPTAERIIVGAQTSVDILIANEADVVVPQGADQLDVTVEVIGDLNGTEQVSVPAMSDPVIVSFPLDTLVIGSWQATMTLTASNEGVQDAPEVIELSGEVIDHSNASFLYAQDLDWYTFDIAFEAGTGVQSFNVWLFNYGFDGSQSLVEIDNVTIPELPLVFNGISTNLIGSIPALMSFEIDTDSVSPDTYISFLPVSVSDEDLLGETAGISMLTVRIEITGKTPDRCPADISGGKGAGDGVVDVSDLLALIAEWGLTDSPADISGADGTPDGIVNVADLLALIAAWGPCP
jgi:hypothetical protein